MRIGCRDSPFEPAAGLDGPFECHRRGVDPRGFTARDCVTRFSVPASGPEGGPYTYAQAKTCTVTAGPQPNSVWTTTTVCS